MWNRHKDKDAHIEEIHIGLFGWSLWQASNESISKSLR
jgi:hypothetical protein